MKAAYYTKFGPADEVLTIGDMPTPSSNQGQVLVRLHATAINPSDVKLRAGARPGAVMEFPRIIPHSDGAGVIEAVGEGVDAERIGQRVWIWHGQWKRPFGTAAEYITLPADQAVPLPHTTSFADGACLGIPAMTAWYALFSDGPIEGKTVLVTGGAGTVGRYACQMARLGGARVITTVSSEQKAKHSTADEWINRRDTDVIPTVLEMTNGAGVDRIVEVDFGGNQADTLALIKPGGVIASYASAGVMQPTLDFYPFMFKNTVLRMLIVYLLTAEDRRKGESQLNKWLAADLLTHAAVPTGHLQDIAAAHDLVAEGKKLGTAVLEI